MSGSRKLALGCIGCAAVQLVIALVVIVALTVLGNQLDTLFQDVGREVDGGSEP